MSKLEISRLVKKFGDFVAVDDLSLTVEHGEFLVLLGPSGCGKTTTMRCVAGLEQADGGVLRIGDQVVSDPANGRHLPPEQRKIGMVFQSYAIWPHMTVAENISFGMRIGGWSRSDMEARLKEVLDLTGLTTFRDRPASALSGGQMQRVAIARSLATRPALILFDEPLSNLDLKLREYLRAELKRVQRQTGITSIYVTHDQTEALALGDRIVVMNKGKIVQVGSPEDIYLRPKVRFVADFIGSPNIVPITLRETGASGQLSGLLHGTHPIMGTSPWPLFGQQDYFVAVRPENIEVTTVCPDNREAGGINCWTGTVRDRMFMGSQTRLVVHAAGVDWVVLTGMSDAGVGDTVWIEIQPGHAQFLPE